jgi:hypothetical protein
MPKQPPTTPESDVPLTERFKRAIGAGRRGQDIRLPQEGRRDPRLPSAPSDTGTDIREGFGIVRGLMKKTSSRKTRQARTRRA